MSNFIENILVDHSFQNLTLLKVLAVEFFCRLGFRVSSLHLGVLLKTRFFFLQHFFFLLALLPGIVLVVGVIDVPLHNIGAK